MSEMSEKEESKKEEEEKWELIFDSHNDVEKEEKFNIESGFIAPDIDTEEYIKMCEKFENEKDSMEK